MLLGFLMYGGILAGCFFVAIMILLVVSGVQIFQQTGRSLPLILSAYNVVVGAFESVIPVHRPDWVWVYFWLPIGLTVGIQLRIRIGQAFPKFSSNLTGEAADALALATGRSAGDKLKAATQDR
jgi:hypothetical protein